MAGDEHKLALLRAVLAPLQIMSRPHGLAIFIGAEKAEVQIVAGILEVVRVAAEKRRGELGSEHQANVGVLLVRVEMVLTSLIQGDDIAPQACLVGRFLFDLGHGLLAGLFGRGVIESGRELGVHPRCHIVDADQHVQLQVGRPGLVGIGPGEKAVAVVVLVLGAELGQGVSPNMVVGHDQPVRRDERSRTAVIESHRRRPQMLGPSRRRLEAVPGLERPQRQVIEDPHSFVGKGRRYGGHENKSGQVKVVIRNVNSCSYAPKSGQASSRPADFAIIRARAQSCQGRGRSAPDARKIGSKSLKARLEIESSRA